MSGYYDRDGRPITLEEWGALIGDKRIEVHRVAHSEWPLSDGTTQRVSTVWLGLDHSYGGGPPLIFETMTFGRFSDQECIRVSTEAEALAVHATFVSDLEAAHGLRDRVDWEVGGPDLPCPAPVAREDVIAAVTELEIAINAKGGNA